MTAALRQRWRQQRAGGLQFIPICVHSHQSGLLRLVGLRRIAVVRRAGTGAARQGLWRDEGNGYRATLMSPGPGFAGPSS